MSRARCGCSNARARRKVEKFVYAASSSCYGLAATPTDEDHPIAPQYPYACRSIRASRPLSIGTMSTGCRSIRFASSTPTARACAQPASTARCSAFSCARSLPASRTRSSATERRRATSSTSPMSRRRSGRGGDAASSASGSMWAPATRSRSIGWSTLGGDGDLRAEASGRARLHIRKYQ